MKTMAIYKTANLYEDDRGVDKGDTAAAQPSSAQTQEMYSFPFMSGGYWW